MAKLAQHLIGIALAAILVGCATPAPSSRCRISGELFSRSGYDLGPSRCVGESVYADWVDWSDGLSEEEAMVIGLWNHPGYQELLADLGIAQADVIQAAQLQNPQVTTMLPLGPKQWEFALQLPVDMLWLQPIRVAAAELESHRVAERLVQDGLNVIRDARVAYIDWQLAMEQLRVAEEGAELRGEIARIAEARLAAGDISTLDVAPIRLDARTAAGEAVRAAHAVELASERLRYALGLQLSDQQLRLAPLTALPPAISLELDQLVIDAVTTRPDLRAVQLAVGAAQQRAELARRSIWNLNAILPDINARGSKGFEAGPGLQFTVPLLHQNQGEQLQSAAEAERLSRQFVNLRAMAAQEVRQAHIQLQQAADDLDLWHEVIPQAESAVAAARNAMREDAVSLLVVLETVRQLMDAQRRECDADAQFRRAVAELERSVGHRVMGTAKT